MMSHEGNPTCQELQGGRQMDQEWQDRAKGRGKNNAKEEISSIY